MTQIKQKSPYDIKLERIFGTPITRGDIITDDIKTVAENLGITNSKLNELIKIYNKDLEGALDEMSSTVDILEVIKESVDNG